VLFNKVDDAVFLNFGVVLEDGRVYSDIRVDPGNPEIQIKVPASPTHKIEGKKLYYHIDRKYAYNLYLVTEHSDGSLHPILISQSEMKELEVFPIISP